MTSAGAAIVVAHPDDESLWLSSALASADRLVFCFGDGYERPRLSKARRRAVAALPVTGLVNLGLPESGAGFSVDWAKPQPTPAGIAIRDAAGRDRYGANFDRLINQLRPILQGFGEVYTHNPWGEYGHAEHIQVYRAVTELQAELGFTIWFSNYVGPLSWPLALQLGQARCWAQSRAVRPDTSRAHALMRVYRRFGAWTWTWCHRWPSQETLYAQPSGGVSDSWLTLSGEWLLDVGGLRWCPPWRKARRQFG